MKLITDQHWDICWIGRYSGLGHWSRTEVQWVRTVNRTERYVDERRGRGLAISQTLSVSDGC